MTAGKGYWLRFPEAGSTTITGLEIPSITVSLSSGWNLIGGITLPIAFENIEDPGGIIVPGSLYGFSGTYGGSGALFPGVAYWIRANADGDVTLYYIPSVQV